MSTDFRQEVLKNLPKAQNINDVKIYLSDTSNLEWPVYRTCKGKDKGKTVMTGRNENKLIHIYLVANILFASSMHHCNFFPSIKYRYI